jgi:putative mRNA 3-end processing factor
VIDIVKAGGHGILLPQLGIAFDYTAHGAEYVFISHAHADHMPRNRSGHVYATSNTVKLMQRRGYTGRATAMEFETTLHTPGADVTLFPAGHILGSAMVYVESALGSILYTGDYRTPPSAATEGFRCPEQVDHFITEATFGLPIYRWPPQQELEERVRGFAAQTLNEGYTPVFLAYSLGKAQEIMHMLAPTQLPVQIHEAGFKLCDVYDEAGIELGNYGKYDPKTCEGKVLITPGSTLQKGFASNVMKKRVAYCSGWAVNETLRSQLSADELIPLSDHLDFFELIGLCKKLNPQKVYLTHTSDASVVQHYLNELGIHSEHLAE